LIELNRVNQLKHIHHMAEKKNVFEADHKVMLIIASPGPEGKKTYLSSVFEDAIRARKFADDFKFECHELIDENATWDNIRLFLSRQNTACLEHKTSAQTGKYLLVVYYTGHGALINGTETWALLFDNQPQPSGRPPFKF